MQVQFSADRLPNPMLEMSEEIIRKCVHCGMCLATCPSYLLLGNELDSPRGRIYQIKDMLEKNVPPPKTLTKHMDRCLSCLSCVTTCPSGVQYGQLADYAREQITDDKNRSWADRALRRFVATTLPNRNLLRIMIKIGTILRPILPQAILPKPIAAMMQLLPEPLHTTLITNKTYNAQGKTLARIGLLPGCVQQVIDSNTIIAAVEFLTRHGVEVTIANADNCCGALVQHMGYIKLARKQARKVINGWKKIMQSKQLDAIVHVASGCGTAVKDYQLLFPNDKKINEITKLARDISEFIFEYAETLPIRYKKLPPLRITYHSACSLRHGQHISEQPLEILRATGLCISEPKESHICCGSAGTYNIFQPDLAEQLKTRKVKNIMATQADIIVTGNLGCIQQLQKDLNTPIIHTIELLNWATGGTIPKSIEKIVKI